MRKRWRTLWRRLAQSFRLMVGVGDYARYCAHVRAHHPELTPMTEAEFHRQAVAARYGSRGVKRCPC